MKGGGRRPFPGDSESLWPHEDAGDRIEHQLMFVPKGYKRNISRLKKILLMDGLGGWSGLPIGTYISTHLYVFCDVTMVPKKTRKSSVRSHQ